MNEINFYRDKIGIALIYSPKKNKRNFIEISLMERDDGICFVRISKINKSNLELYLENKILVLLEKYQVIFNENCKKRLKSINNFLNETKTKDIYSLNSTELKNKYNLYFFPFGTLAKNISFNHLITIFEKLNIEYPNLLD